MYASRRRFLALATGAGVGGAIMFPAAWCRAFGGERGHVETVGSTRQMTINKQVFGKRADGAKTEVYT